MDFGNVWTLRDKELLNKIIKSGKFLGKIFNEKSKNFIKIKKF